MLKVQLACLRQAQVSLHRLALLRYALRRCGLGDGGQHGAFCVEFAFSGRRVMKPFTEIVTLANGRCISAEYFSCAASRYSILMIGGAFATTRSVHPTVQHLCEDFNVIAFDWPFAGASLQHNPAGGVVTSIEETEILLELFDRYRPNIAASMSWGGVALLMALTHAPASVECAMLGSFSLSLSVPMKNYLLTTLEHLRGREIDAGVSLFNATLGSTLPRVYQALNARHLRKFAFAAPEQIEHHISHVLRLDVTQYMEQLAKIKIPLLFVNGGKDIYTPPQSAKDFHAALPNARFEVITQSGHFLSMEGSAIGVELRKILRGFFMEQRLLAGA